MRTRVRAAAAALAAVSLLSGCTGGDDGGTTTTQDPAALVADAIVLMKAGSTDLNALDLRDKLVPLAGVESVVYDQSVKRLRINFTPAATAEQRALAVQTATDDPAVERVREAGQADEVSQQPVPGGGSQPAPAATP